MARKPDSLVRAFGMSGFQILSELDALDKQYDLELGHQKTAERKRQLEGYDQFEKDVRSEASMMSEYFEIFYCLENSIRKLITDTLVDDEGISWWNSARIPEQIRRDVENRRNREIDSGVTPRSDFEIDFTTFGELSTIISRNWDLFEPILNTQRGVERILAQLNLLRGPIAHCCPISDDEKSRLELAVSDWFRLLS